MSISAEFGKIDAITQNELNNHLNVKGAMGGNITLVSNCSIGFGGSGFVSVGLFIFHEVALQNCELVTIYM